MLSKSKVALVAALVFGSASAALAEEPFDVNIYRPVPPAAATNTGARGAYAQVPTPHRAKKEFLAAPDPRKGAYGGW